MTSPLGSTSAASPTPGTWRRSWSAPGSRASAWPRSASGYRPRPRGTAVAWLGASLAAAGLVGEVARGTARVSELVAAVKRYSYLDQAPAQAVDLVEGLESTLTMLGHALTGIDVVRDYDPALPRIPAFGGELNQVWTNLIDNAVAAMAGRGRLTVRAAREAERVLVEIGDDGPGIPPEVLPRIFEPFFTTKPVGEGPASASTSPAGSSSAATAATSGSSPGPAPPASRFGCRSAPSRASKLLHDRRPAIHRAAKGNHAIGRDRLPAWHATARHAADQGKGRGA
jgi:hypothetical protein